MMTGDVEREIVIVGTDRAAPTPVLFAMFMSEDGMTPQALNDPRPRCQRGTRMATATSPTTLPFFNVVAGTDNVNLPLIMSPAFASGSGSQNVLTFDRPLADADDTTPGNQPREGYSTAGSYNGASGTYSCADDANDCTVHAQCYG